MDKFLIKQRAIVLETTSAVISVINISDTMSVLKIDAKENLIHLKDINQLSDFINGIKEELNDTR